MCKAIFFGLMALCVSEQIYAQAPGYLNVLNTAGTTGTAGNTTYNYSVGEVIVFSNACIYTPGVVQPRCLLCVSVTEVFDQKYKASFFPNPTHSQVIVETDFSGFSTYTISSANGQTLESGGFNYLPIDLSRNEPGTYFLRLSTSDNQIFKTVKIIKQ